MTASSTFILPEDLGTNGQVLQTLGNGSTTWVTLSSGSSSAAGNNGEIQYNDNNSFGASSGLYFNSTDQLLGVQTSSPSFTLDINGDLRVGDDNTQGKLQIYRENGATDYKIEFVAPLSLSNSLTFTWPSDDGIGGQVIVTDASGNLSWGVDGTLSGDCVGQGTGEQDGSNNIDGTDSFVGGGTSNGATGDESFVGGGTSNTIYSDGAGIVTGSGNVIDTNGDYAIIGAGSNNYIDGRSSGIFAGTNHTIENGSQYSMIGAGQFNTIYSDYSVIAGGISNTIWSNSDRSIIGAGQSNEITSAPSSGIMAGSTNEINTAYASIIGAGSNNTLSGSFSFIGAGINNTLDGDYSVILGGNSNDLTGDYSGIAGGNSNTVNADYAFILGENSSATANYAVAMGNYTNANYEGSFVFGDRNTTVVSATTTNMFVSRFDNGYDFYTNSGASLGVKLDNGDSAWETISDKNKKQDIILLNKVDVLERLRSLPIYSWSYKGFGEKGIRNYGPMAQDFHSLFGKDSLGTIGSQRTISTHDQTSIGIAATQALIDDNAKKLSQLEDLRKKNDDMEERIKRAKILLEKLEVQNSGGTHE